MRKKTTVLTGFKKLSDQKGSVLFMVLSIMVVLIILAQSLYFVVMTTRDTQYNDLAGKQAYQATVSLNELISAKIKYGNDDFQKAVMGLQNVGDKLTMTSAPAGLAADDLAAIGEVKNITVTKKNSQKIDKEYQVFEIVTTVDRNGIEQTTKTTLMYTEEVDVFNKFDRFFTSTGYSTEDVYLYQANIHNPAYFDNQYTEVSGYKAFDTIITAGTLKIKKYDFWDTGTNKDLIARNDLIVTNAVKLFTNGGSIYVGGDFIAEGNVDVGNSSEIGSMFVIGDATISGTMNNKLKNLFVGGDLVINSASSNLPIYVNGNADVNINVENASPLYVKGDIIKRGGGLNGKIYYGGNVLNTSGNVIANPGSNYVKVHNNYTMRASDSGTIYYTGTLENPSGLSTGATYTQLPSDFWEIGNVPLKHSVNRVVSDFLYGGTALTSSISNVQTLIDQKAKEFLYPQWEPSKNLTLTDLTGLNPDGTKKIVITEANPTCYINYDAVIGEFDIVGTNWGVNKGWKVPTFVFENTNSSRMRDGKLYTPPLVIKLTKNFVDANGKNAFRWSGNGTDRAVNVIIRGHNPVIFEIEKDVKYYANTTSYVGHEYGFNLIEDSRDMPPNFSNADKTKWESYKIQNENNKINFGDDVALVNLARSKSLSTNLFLVTVDQNADIDLTAKYNMFVGFIYAPYMTYESRLADNVKGIGIVGGMIVADYILEDNKAYVFFQRTGDEDMLTDLLGESITTLPTKVNRAWRQRW